MVKTLAPMPASFDAVSKLSGKINATQNKVDALKKIPDYDSKPVIIIESNLGKIQMPLDDIILNTIISHTEASITNDKEILKAMVDELYGGGSVGPIL